MAYVGGSAGVFVSLILTASVHNPSPLIIPALFGVSAWGIYRSLRNSHRQELEELRTEKQALLEKITGHLYLQPTRTQTESNTYNSPLKSEKEPLEVRIMDVLALKQGRFTLIEAVVYLREPIDQVLPTLEKLQQSGIIGTDVSDTGEIIYVTSSFRNTAGNLV
jgi:hypothetical protein